MPRPSDEFMVLCTRSLSGEASPAERRRLHGYLRCRDHFEFYEEVRRRWQASGGSAEPGLDALRAWTRLEERLASAGRPEKVASPGSFDRIGRALAPWLAAAALVALGLGFSYWSIRTEMHEGGPRLQQRVTAPGECATLVLGDGTRVTLNGASALTYPARFGATRRVALRGEAFFTVAHDPAHPFVVNAGGVRATVLGTRFNVAVIPNRAAAVSLLAGRVRVEPLRAAPAARAALLEPGEQFTYDARNGSAHVARFDPDAVTAWRRGALVFRRTPLVDVAAQLERKFGVRFEFAEPSLATKTVDGRFERESLAEILQVLSFAGGLECLPVREHGEIARVRIASASGSR